MDNAGGVEGSSEAARASSRRQGSGPGFGTTGDSTRPSSNPGSMKRSATCAATVYRWCSGCGGYGPTTKPIACRCCARHRCCEGHVRLRACQRQGRSPRICFPYFPESGAAAMADPAIRALIAYYNPIELEMWPLIERLQRSNRGFIAIRPVVRDQAVVRRGVDRSLRHASIGARRASAEGRTATTRMLSASAPGWRSLSEIGEHGVSRFAVRFPLLQSDCASVAVVGFRITP